MMPPRGDRMIGASPCRITRMGQRSAPGWSAVVDISYMTTIDEFVALLALLDDEDDDLPPFWD
jgi:hypothetical protein